MGLMNIRQYLTFYFRYSGDVAYVTFKDGKDKKSPKGPIRIGQGYPVSKVLLPATVVLVLMYE